MKSIVGIIGSLRKDSVHRVLFHTYQELATEHMQLSEGLISEIPLYNADVSPHPQSVTSLGTQILESDGVIFFAPEYNYSVSGVLKNVIDWLSRDERLPFNGKQAAIIGASPGGLGTARMQYHLRQIGVFLNLHFLNKPEVMIPQIFDKIKNNRLEDPATIEHLQKHIMSFCEQIT